MEEKSGARNNLEGTRSAGAVKAKGQNLVKSPAAPCSCCGSGYDLFLTVRVGLIPVGGMGLQRYQEAGQGLKLEELGVSIVFAPCMTDLLPSFTASILYSKLPFRL